ncbi:DUF3006 domain-containing protein [Caproiciproducens sp. CPB-2]|uniref:DUF3006 domain-containing protein n=1 Tax=Caproiciproducens sp. CPB-2 TaxID=3030017 RepID=UPI0023DA90C3|nr:DUF3006 domain-containing protein [Caproiciproducens sp. CPB-2]MDF1496029.1 DUF3006 domain-containing protein [Caproiciproducens sp. CPB-2]
MKMLVIDRFEGTYAICEDKDQKFFAIETTELPQGAREGDVLNVDAAEGALSINAEATAQRRSKTKKLQDKLFQ